jgi:hypothetical protein
VKELNASHGWVNQFKQWHSFHNYNLVEKEAVLMRLQFLNFLKNAKKLLRKGDTH